MTSHLPRHAAPRAAKDFPGPAREAAAPPPLTGRADHGQPDGATSADSAAGPGNSRWLLLLLAFALVMLVFTLPAMACHEIAERLLNPEPERLFAPERATFFHVALELPDPYRRKRGAHESGAAA
jgi:hypothetical protein